MAFQVNVRLSGLMVCAREADIKSKVTHVLLADARHDNQPHYPEVRFCLGGLSVGPLLFTRKRLVLEWLDAQGRTIPMPSGADPVIVVPQIGDLPFNTNRNDLRWLPDLTMLTNGKVPSKHLQATRVDAVVVGQVVLDGGEIRTEDFGWGMTKEGTVGALKKWIPRLEFGNSGSRAAAESLCWAVEAPVTAVQLNASLKDLDDPGLPDAGLRGVPVAADSELGLEITNSPRPWGTTAGDIPRGRRAGEVAKHFLHLKSLLDGGSAMPVPQIPADIQNNSVAYDQLDSNPCGGCPPIDLMGKTAVHTLTASEAAEEPNWLHFGRSLADRPLCVPGGAMTEP